MDRNVWDDTTIRESLLFFGRICIAKTPPLCKDEEDEAAALAEQRFEGFLDHVRDALNSERDG